MDSLVVLTFLVVAALEIAVPVCLGRWVRKRFDVSWRLFGLGALFFILIQVAHILFILVTQSSLTAYLTQLAIGQVAFLVILALYLGVLAGLFEELGRFFVFTKFFKKQKIRLKRENALMFGIGWGGVEAIMVALVMILTMFSYSMATPLTDQDLQDLNDQYGGTLTQEQLDAIRSGNEVLLNLTPADLLPGLFERMMAMVLQVAFTLMVFASALSSRKTFLVIAIAFHSFVDFLAVYTLSTYGVLVAELSIVPLTAIALLYIRSVFTKPK